MNSDKIKSYILKAGLTLLAVLIVLAGYYIFSQRNGEKSGDGSTGAGRNRSQTPKPKGSYIVYALSQTDN